VHAIAVAIGAGGAVVIMFGPPWDSWYAAAGSFWIFRSELTFDGGDSGRYDLSRSGARKHQWLERSIGMKGDCVNENFQQFDRRQFRTASDAQEFRARKIVC